MKKALITGITGQDGSYLARFLVDKGYKVYGLMRRVSTDPFARIEDLYIDGSILKAITTFADYIYYRTETRIHFAA